MLKFVIAQIFTKFAHDFINLIITIIKRMRIKIFYPD